MAVQNIALDRQIAEAENLLRDIVRQHAPAALASSFSAEDMILLDMIAGAAPEIEVFTLDTGRLPEETYTLIAESRTHYDHPIRIYTPESKTLEAYMDRAGPNAFYASVACRVECCAIRKLEPLRRALTGRKAWLTGQRQEQSVTRRSLAIAEWDEANSLHKFNPLAEWSRADVWRYIGDRNVPYSPLYDRGYASIGCAPCTRPVTVGEDERAGRWWWEEPEQKECGLHLPRPSPGKSETHPKGER
jgi:phosphoadenosine phosphosulfate reductase